MLTEYVKVKMDRATHAKLKRRARREGKSMSRLLRESAYSLAGQEIDALPDTQPPLLPPRLEPWRSI